MNSRDISINHLVIFSSGMIGDFMMLLGVVENAHQLSKHFRATFLVTRNATFFREILGSQHSYVEIVDLERNKENVMKYFFRTSKNLIKIAFTKNALLFPVFLKGDSITTVLFGWIMTRFPGSRFVCFANHDEYFKKFLCSDVLKFDFEQSFYDNHTKALEMLGVKHNFKTPVYRYTPDKKILAQHCIDSKYIVIHIASTRRRWTFTIPRWKKVVEQILNLVPDSSVILTGSPADFSFIENLASLFPKARVKNCAGSFSASELVSVIHFSELYIGVDTGISHIAATMEKKSLVIGHQYLPSTLPSYNPNAIVLTNKNECKCLGNYTLTCSVVEGEETYMRCTYFITDEMLETALRKILNIKNLDTIVHA